MPAGGPAAASGAEPLLAVEDLTVDFLTEGGVVHAVRGVSFSVEPGEVVGVVGESGAGKSATALAVMGLLGPSAAVTGSVRYRGREITTMSQKGLTALRGRDMAVVFQDPTTALSPVHSVGWHLAEAILAHQDVSKREALDRSVELLALVGIPEPRRRAGNYPHEFSGGMRQRVLIAMAVANDPDLIVADEPTSALDVTVQAQVLDALEKAQAETGAAIVIITHDLGVVARVARRVMVMYAGRVVEHGSVDDVYHRPRMPYTLGLLRSLPRLDGQGTPPEPIPGHPPSPVSLPPGCPFWPRCPLSRDGCRDAEPALRAVNGADHLSACHFAEELGSEAP